MVAKLNDMVPINNITANHVYRHEIVIENKHATNNNIIVDSSRV
jgi:hypothetical protein